MKFVSNKTAKFRSDRSEADGQTDTCSYKDKVLELVLYKQRLKATTGRASKFISIFYQQLQTV